MKKVAYLALLASLLAGCKDTSVHSDSIKGSGQVVALQQDFADFSRIALSHAFEATITREDSFSVVLRVDGNMVEYLDTSMNGNRLEIGLESGNSYSRVKLEADITAPDLEGLFLSGASRASLSGFDLAHEFEFGLSGATRVSGSMNTGRVECQVSGASRLALEGWGGDLEADISGASTLELGDFAVQNAEVEVSGASAVTVNVAGTLNAELSGASKLNYYGNPTMGEVSTSGASTIQQAD